MNVLFVSNSTCYYFTDELMGLFKAAGYTDVPLALTIPSARNIPITAWIAALPRSSAVSFGRPPIRLSGKPNDLKGTLCSVPFFICEKSEKFLNFPAKNTVHF